jgi:NADH dehydrogenase
MRFAITGGTGFVGGHLARLLLRGGHEVIVIARGGGGAGASAAALIASGARIVPSGLSDEHELAAAFEGVDGVAHCAGINREIGDQTYRHVHVEGTRNVVNAARRAGVTKVVLLSFLRARAGWRGLGSAYHESKWQAEEIVRASGLDYTVLKPGIIYGRGDHMLDHLSRAFHTFPLFALVGMNDRSLRPAAVEDVARIIEASLVEGRLARQTVAVLGPEEMTLSEAVRRVARVVARRPLMFRMPRWFHYAMASVLERVMAVPLVSTAQVRILSEGLTEPLPPCPPVPEDLGPQTPFSEDQIRKGLPEAAAFGPSACLGWERLARSWRCQVSR